MGSESDVRRTSDGLRSRADCDNWAKLRKGCEDIYPIGFEGPCSSTDAELPENCRGLRDVEQRTYKDIFNEPCSTPCKKKDGLGKSEDYFWCW